MSKVAALVLVILALVVGGFVGYSYGKGQVSSASKTEQTTMMKETTPTAGDSMMKKTETSPTSAMMKEDNKMTGTVSPSAMMEK